MALAPACALAGPDAAALFNSRGCRTCHRIGEVGGNSGPDLSMVGFRHSHEWLIHWLSGPGKWKHDSLMPDYKLSAPEIEVLAQFLSEQRGQSFGGVPPWNEPRMANDSIARGRVLYRRAGCAACHGAGGRGGQPNNNVPGDRIPALDHVRDTFSADELKLKIRRGVAEPAKADLDGPAPMVSMPRWADILKDDEIDAVAAYLMSLGGPSTGAEW